MGSVCLQASSFACLPQLMELRIFAKLFASDDMQRNLDESIEVDLAGLPSGFRTLEVGLASARPPCFLAVNRQGVKPKQNSRVPGCSGHGHTILDSRTDGALNCGGAQVLVPDTPDTLAITLAPVPQGCTLRFYAFAIELQVGSHRQTHASSDLHSNDP